MFSQLRENNQQSLWLLFLIKLFYSFKQNLTSWQKTIVAIVTKDLVFYEQAVVSDAMILWRQALNSLLLAKTSKTLVGLIW